MLKNFDTSNLDSEVTQILKEFSQRRTIIDAYIKKQGIDFFSCPGCGFPTLGERGVFEICSVCDWEDDGQDDPKADERWGGPNLNLSLTENRINIGITFKKLCQFHGADLLASPEKIIAALNEREKIVKQVREKIQWSDDISHPVWNELIETKQNSLRLLIEKSSG